MSAAIEALGAVGGGVLVIKVTGAAVTANAGLGAIANPEGVDLLILRTTWFVDVESTGSANISIGVTTVAAAATDILNALDANGAAGKAYNGHAMQNSAKTEITAPAIWSAAKYITITGSATSAGMVAYLMVEYVKLPA
jgi:hypothetical protein